MMYLVPESFYFKSIPGEVVEKTNSFIKLKRHDGIVGVYSFSNNTLVEVLS